MEATRRLNKDYLPARIAVLILCGAAIQVLPTLSTLNVLVTSLALNIAFLFPINPTALTVYLILTIVYSSLVSSIFPPRRLVSPILIQVTSVAIVSIIVTTAFVGVYATQLQESPTLYPIIADRLAFSIFLSVFFAAIIGAVQSLMVGEILGLIFETIDVKTYMINAEFSSLNTILRDRRFLALHTLRIKQESKNAILLQRNVGVQRQILVAKREETYAILATVAYEVRYGVMSIGLGSTDVMIDIKSHILGRLKEHYPNADITDRLGDERATQIATTYAMRGTESAATVLNRLSRWQQIASLGIIAFLVVTSYLLSIRQLSDAQYFEGLVVVVIGGLLELAPLVAETLKERSALKGLLE